MGKTFYFLLVLSVLVSCSDIKEGGMSKNTETYQGPIRLLPANTLYFEYKGEPTVLITSAEHYGALLNQAFDYRQYLETLSEAGMNYTRIFAGTYAEIPSESFGIQNNTLAPEPENFLTPWSFVKENDKRLYDLNSWNEAYFERLHDLMRTAAGHDIIVEFTFFTSIYRDAHWDINPQNPENNINIDHEITRYQANTLNNGELIEYQEKLVRKVVRELNEYDNLFYEIQNEPWADHNVPVLNIVNKEDLNEGDWTYKVDIASEEAKAWQEAIAGFIEDEESELDQKHLVAQNYCNFKAPIAEVADNISIINFHYAWPEAAEWNYGWNRVIGFDESGFAGSGDQVYRRQAWRFILSGGGLFNNLDYSFFTGYEDGTLNNSAPGGGSVELRKQLRILSEFIHGLDLAGIHPDKISIEHAPGMIPYMLSVPGRSYAMYLQSVNMEKSELHLRIPDGKYRITWINTFTGNKKEEEFESVNGEAVIDVIFNKGEIAARIDRM